MQREGNKPNAIGKILKPRNTFKLCKKCNMTKKQVLTNEHHEDEHSRQLWKGCNLLFLHSFYISRALKSECKMVRKGQTEGKLGLYLKAS
jgi:hypothetical protein